MSDTIDRQAAIDELIYEPYYVEMHPLNIINRLRDRIKALPSAQSEPQWTPCSERLPDHEDRVLCCTYTKAGIPNHVIGYYASGRWCCGMNSNVVAWMPLPDPYVMEE